MNIRIGEGWDIHALVEGRKLILGGIEIPFEKGLLGHSDADALLHAITDAILGAAALGDIGTLFPDTDAQFKGADSAVLLAEATRRVRAMGYAISNVDCTVIAQAPKLAPYKAAMRERIANVLSVSPDQVNVKAKTAEKMGPVGEGRAMEARAVVLLTLGLKPKGLQALGARCSLRLADSPPVVELFRAKAPPMRWMVFSTIASPRPAPLAAVRAASPR